MKTKASSLLYVFPIIKLLIHVLTATTYGFHRDEYLYLDQGNHLAWGFAEIPPVLPFFSWILNGVGSPIWLVRMIPAFAGALLIYLACRLVHQFGGGKWAIAFTGVGLLFSPALLGINSLYQPVSFNLLCWFLTAYVAVQIVRQQDKRWWYVLGGIIGLGFLTKYSIVFYVLALLGGVLMTPQRKLLFTPQVLIAGGIALLIALPNLIWQYQFNWPVFRHMRELQETQLVHMDWPTFLVPQLLFHFTFSIIWIAGLIGLFRSKQLKPYRFTGIALIITIALIGFLSGKIIIRLALILFCFPSEV